MAGIIAFAWALDAAGPGIYNPQIYRSLFLVSIMPIEVFATLLELHPRQPRV